MARPKDVLFQGETMKLAALICLLASAMFSQTVIATIPTGANPVDVAVNLNTHKAYVLNLVADTVTIIDLTTKAAHTIPSCNGPWIVKVNEVTGYAYVGCQYSGNVQAIDPSDNTVAYIPAAGSGLVGMNINPVTNMLATSNEFANSATFIDLSTNTVIKTIAVPFPEQVDVDPTLNLWVFANENAGTATVVDGSLVPPVGGGGGGSCGAPGSTNPQISIKPSNYYPANGSTFALNVALIGPTCGVVTFTDNGTVIGTGNVNAQGQASISFAIASGSHAFKAQFAGSPGYAAATSATVWIHN